MSEPARILVVDDNLEVCHLFRKILEWEGYRVECAYDGDEAMTRLGENTFHLVVTDIEMPILNGLQLLQHIRENSSTAVILVTGLSPLDVALKDMPYEADGYLAKPLISNYELVSAVKRCLSE